MTNLKRVVVINAFNEAKTITKAIDSVIDHVDEVRIFDGAYREYPHDAPYSTDGMLELLKERYGDNPKVKVYEIEIPWINQNIKRTTMFCDPDPHYYIKLDADEIIVNPEVLDTLDWGSFDIGYTWHYSNLYPQKFSKPIIFRNIPGMHYEARHHWLFDGNYRLICSDQKYNVDYEVIETDLRVFNMRDDKRESNKSQMRKNRTWEHKHADESKVYNVPFTAVKHPERAGTPLKPAHIVKDEGSTPTFSFCLMFSREWMVDKYFARLREIEIPDQTEALVLIDSNRLPMYHDILRHLESPEIASKFTKIKVRYTGRRKMPEYATVSQRRKRIVDNWNFFLTEARGEMLLGAEDDSIPPVNAYTLLLKTMKDKGYDFVQGNIMGRWGVKMCPAWKVEEVDGEPVKLYSLPEQDIGVSDIEACGWYCFVATTSMFRSVEIIEKKDILPLGPDVRFGYMATKAGYKLAHLWDVKVEHHVEKNNPLIIGQTKTSVYSNQKRNGEWIKR